MRDKEWSYARTKNAGRYQVILRFPNGHERLMREVDVLPPQPNEIVTIPIRVSVLRNVGTLDTGNLGA